MRACCPSWWVRLRRTIGWRSEGLTARGEDSSCIPGVCASCGAVALAGWLQETAGV